MRAVCLKLMIVVLGISLAGNIVTLTYCRKLSREYTVVQSNNMSQQEANKVNTTTIDTQQNEIALIEKILTPEEIDYIAQRQWEYKLLINGNEVNSNTITMEKTHNVSIVIAAIDKSKGEVPQEILEKGKLWRGESGEVLADYLLVDAVVDYELIKTKQENNIKYCYQFKDVPKGTIITIEINELLKEKLDGMDKVEGNRLQVIVK